MPTIGAGAAMVTWGLGAAGSAATIAWVLIAAFAMLWTITTSLPWVHVVLERASSLVARVSLAADIGLAAATGGLLAALAPQTPGGFVVHAVVLTAGAVIIDLAAGAYRRATERETAMLAAGMNGEARVAAVLRSLPSDFVVLHDALVPAKRGPREVDHIVLGPTGVYVIETKHWSGSLTPGDPFWVQHKGFTTQLLPSPERQLVANRAAVAARLGLRPESVRMLLVFTAGTVESGAGVVIVRPDQLVEEIRNTRAAWPLAERPLAAARRLVRS